LYCDCVHHARGNLVIAIAGWVNMPGRLRSESPADFVGMRTSRERCVAGAGFGNKIVTLLPGTSQMEDTVAWLRKGGSYVAFL
jgi:hypothetical protein